jgi:hypothetical protein
MYKVGKGSKLLLFELVMTEKYFITIFFMSLLTTMAYQETDLFSKMIAD